MRNENGNKTTAYNVRFCEMAAVTPQTILYKFARYYPTGTVVEAPPAQAAGTLEAMRGQHSDLTE
jgi:hypothetical protein